MKPLCVLVAPLDWGLGHATRCVPVVRQLLLEKCDVILAGSGISLDLLKMEFPSLQRYTLPGYDPQYSASGMVFKMAVQLYKFIRVIKAEHTAVQEIVRKSNVDIIISDNRYGCWSPSTRNIFITHQLKILMPIGVGWLGKIVNRVNHNAIRKFHHCWIPDCQGEESLSGKLSTKKVLNATYIGLLSRFTTPAAVDKKYDILILLSGPEPQRSILERILSRQLAHVVALKVAVVTGVQERRDAFFPAQVELIHFPSAARLQSVIESSEIIIARSGYSTLMDLARLRKRAIFIPTPGQTEQEYLAKRMEKKGIAYFADQNKFELTKALEKSKHYAGFFNGDVDRDLLKRNIAELLEHRCV